MGQTEKVKPITPDEVADKKLNVFPDAVFETFNTLISQKAVGKRSIRIETKEAVDLMVKKGLKEDDIFENGWLNIEDVYRQAGWKVEYDKPAYNENYEPHFTFTPDRKQRD